MERRNFLIGMGSTAAGASALIGSGAFSRVESHRSVAVEVANDENAYLGMEPLDTANSQNYVALDDDGHLYIQIDGEGDQQDVGNDGPDGQGVNSDSTTYFDGMFNLCNQGKEEVTISYELPETATHPSVGDDWTATDTEYDEQVIGFYYIADAEDANNDGDVEEGDRIFVEAEQGVPLPLGECVEIGLRTVTKGIDATAGESLIDGELVITADTDA